MVIMICKLIIQLFVFAVIGWIMEVTLKYLEYHRFINRGYLLGPYCPIYGCGVVAITIMEQYVISPNNSDADIFLVSVVICGALEYFVSWGLEKLFHARWWDYSKRPMNLNGRIWIGNLLLFGVGSLIIIKWINPHFFGMLMVWPDWLLILLAVCIVCLLVTDNVISGIVMNRVKDAIDSREEDSTEEITKKVREILLHNRYPARRISSAFPNLQARPKRLTAQLKEAQRELKEAVQFFKTLTDESREQVLEESGERVRKARAKLAEVQEKFKTHDKDFL